LRPSGLSRQREAGAGCWSRFHHCPGR
jgi:hypothetical protein